MEHFYVTLPSNSSEDYYGKQPLSSYKTHLAKPLTLDINQWEVGLAEIIYPHSWKNVSDGHFEIKMLVDTGRASEWQWKTAVLESAMYDTPIRLVHFLNEAADRVLKDQKGRVRFFYNDLLRKMTAYVEESYMVRFPKAMSVMLGLGDKVTTLRQSHDEAKFGVEHKEERTVINNSKIVAPHRMDLTRGLHSFFVYCAIVGHQLVGDANVPLVRTLAVKGDIGDVVDHAFDNIHYMGLSRSTFQEIHIHITDDTGKEVPFDYGRVIVKLHFRQKI